MRKFFQILLLAFLCASFRAQANVTNGLYIVVNDAVITYGEMEREVVPALDTAAQLYGLGTPEYTAKKREIIKNISEAFIDRKLILNEFTKAGYNLPESFIDDEINDDIKKNFYGDRAQLIATLQLRGVSFETYRQQQRERIIVDYMKHEKTSSKKILISPKQVEDYYRAHETNFTVGDEVKLRMIVIDGSGAAAKRVAEEVLKKLDEGVSFAEMASIYSTGPYRTQGGDRGWIGRSEKMASNELLNTAFSLKPGQHSGIIELPGACYILQVDDVRPGHVKPLTDATVRSEIEETLKSEVRSHEYKKWIDRLRKKVLVLEY